MTVNHRDNYGYYIYKGVKTYSKYDIMVAAESAADVTWNYNDEFFSTFDWTKEPSARLNELYQRRAAQLREQYDYLILMYSGGSDSDNALEAFVRGQIHLDEVCHLVDLKRTDGARSLLNEEIFSLANPKIKRYISEYNLRTHARVVDISQHQLDCFNQSTKFDFIHQCDSFGNRIAHAKSQAYKSVPKWLALRDQGKKVCIIWGGEKPNVRGVNRRYYFHFVDKGIDGSMGIIGPQDSGIDSELFYWGQTNECAQILIKQSHVIKNFMAHVTEEYQYSVTEEVNCTELRGNKKLRVGGSLFKTLIYPYYQQTVASSIKSISGNWLSDRDPWFYSRTTEESVRLFLNGVHHLIQACHPIWMTSTMEFQGKQYPSRIRSVPSKLYPLQ